MNTNMYYEKIDQFLNKQSEKTREMLFFFLITIPTLSFYWLVLF